MQSITEYTNMFITLVAIVDPLGGIPILLTLMPGKIGHHRLRAAWLAALTVALVLVGSALAGEKLLQIFGIQIDSFRVAGGLLLLLVGIRMMLAEEDFLAHRSKLAKSVQDEDGFIFVPLAIPLLSGPGAISSMIIYAHRLEAWTHSLMLITVSILVALVTGLTLSLAQPISRWLGANGLKISMRLMGLLLSAAAIQFIANGLIALFPALVK